MYQPLLNSLKKYMRKTDNIFGIAHDSKVAIATANIK
jgi:hypothetical protein